MYSSKEFQYKLTTSDREKIKSVMIKDGIDPEDKYFELTGLFTSTPPLANIMYVMDKRCVIPTETHKLCLEIHTNHVQTLSGLGSHIESHIESQNSTDHCV